MTSVCVGNGPSQARPGFGETVSMTASGIAALLNNIPTVWAVPFAAYLGLITYRLSEFCPGEPPAVPTITALDVVGLLDVFNPVVNVSAGEKFQQLIGAYAWYQMCQCVSGTQPTPPAAPAAPANLPQVNPPTVTGPAPALTACATRLEPSTFDITGTQTFSRGPLVMPLNGPITARLTMVNTIISGGGVPVDFSFQTDTAGSPLIQQGTSVFRQNPGSSRTVVVPVASAATEVRFVYTAAGGTGHSDLQGSTIELFCDGDFPGNRDNPCCPPDEISQGMITQILGLVQLIQRQIAPFAYVTSTVHAGLTGEGHIAVQGLIGAKVQLTTIPSNIGIEDADPLRYWDAGWINWGNADGSTQLERITCSPQVSLPAAAGQYTRIGYSLPAGAAITLTELVREP